MNRIAAAIIFFLMASILYGADIIAASVSPSGQEGVGYTPIILSVLALIIGIALLVKEKDYRDSLKEDEKRKPSFLDKDLDNN
ncbi:hypothetical protein [Falsibacillus pallidus]|uniref:hypothetical protein n=1 Tax=Falsibacillus pallidus TaxID=493781 RepID=UPI003D9567DD